MQTAIVCLIIAALLPYATVAIAKSQPGYDNAAPRDWGAQLQGFRRRAYAAHLNHFESFPLFATGVIVAALRGVPDPLLASLSIAYVVLRIAYVAAYVTDRGAIRSLLWTAALACPLWLLVAALQARQPWPIQ
jgi:uncharacterized MAPEG superfamily protein